MHLRIAEHTFEETEKQFTIQTFNINYQDIDQIFSYREDVYIPRKRLGELYNNHITENERFPQRRIGKSEFSSLMTSLSSEKNLVYKRMKMGFVYSGLCLSSELPSPPPPKILLSEEQKHEKKNFLYYREHRNIILVRSKIRRIIINIITGEASPLTKEDYKLIEAYDLLQLKYNTPEELLPWRLSGIQDLSLANLEELVYRHLDFTESISQTIAKYEEWKRTTGQVSDEERQLVDRRIWDQLFRSFEWD